MMSDPTTADTMVITSIAHGERLDRVIKRSIAKRSIARAFDQKELWSGNRQDWRRWL